MSDFRQFINSRILRNPTTWIVAVIGFAYGGYRILGIRELARAAGDQLQTPWLATDRALDFTLGGLFQVFGLMCAVWIVAGLLEDANVWVRQTVVVTIYLGLNLLTLFL